MSSLPGYSGVGSHERLLWSAPARARARVMLPGTRVLILYPVLLPVIPGTAVDYSTTVYELESIIEKVSARGGWECVRSLHALPAPSRAPQKAASARRLPSWLAPQTTSASATSRVGACRQRR